MTYEQAKQVARADELSGICFAVDKLEELGFDCASYHKEISESDEQNFDADNIQARNHLYERLGIMDIMKRAYEEVCR